MLHVDLDVQIEVGPVVLIMIHLSWSLTAERVASCTDATSLQLCFTSDRWDVQTWGCSSLHKSVDNVLSPEDGWHVVESLVEVHSSVWPAVWATDWLVGIHISGEHGTFPVERLDYMEVNFDQSEVKWDSVPGVETHVMWVLECLHLVL